MDPFDYFQNTFSEAIRLCVANHGWPDRAVALVRGEPPRDVTHGDIALPLPLMIAKMVKRQPIALATELAAALSGNDAFASVTVHKPGFVNIRLANHTWQTIMAEIIKASVTYGFSRENHDKTYNVEFVSANPTGPLTLGNARGAIIGDVLASILATTGATVSREYYVNDSGVQIDHLANGLWHRMRESMGENPGDFPANSYPGDYLKDVARDLVTEGQVNWTSFSAPERHTALRKEAVSRLLAVIKQNLNDLGVKMDHYASEDALIRSNVVDDTITALVKQGVVYEGQLPPPEKQADDDWQPRDQLLFRSTDYGDDRDRPLRKSDGSWTYFASDISYHLDKIARLSPDKRKNLIDIVGADHSGYIKRIAAAVKVASPDDVGFYPVVTQIVRLVENDQVKKMSKRAGTMVPVAELLARIPRDVLRFHMLMRSASANLDIDVDAWERETNDNPVYYVQYAHARICSLRERAGDALWRKAISQTSWPGLTKDWELQLLHTLAQWPRRLGMAAKTLEPHRIGIYLHALASQYHHAWALARQDRDSRFIIVGNDDLTFARLALSECVRTVIVSGLNIIGVTPQTQMDFEKDV